MGVPKLVPILNYALGPIQAQSPILCDAIIVDCNIIFHQSLYQADNMWVFQNRIKFTFIRKLKYILELLTHPCTVYFCFDGISGKVKHTIQQIRRQQKPVRNHLLPCTSTMYYMEFIIQSICTEMGLTSAYISDSFTPGEGEYKGFQWCSSQPDIQNIIIISLDNDFLALSLLRMDDYSNIYIYQDKPQLLHVNKIADSLKAKNINIPLFVFSSFIFGNDYSNAMVFLTDKNMQKLLSFLVGKPLIMSGLYLRKTSGSHTWNIGKSTKVFCFSSFHYSKFVDQLFQHVPIKRTRVGHSINKLQFLWNLKYYYGDPNTNLYQMNRNISYTEKNHLALNPVRFHRRLGTSHLLVPNLFHGPYFRKLTM